MAHVSYVFLLLEQKYAASFPQSSTLLMRHLIIFEYIQEIMLYQGVVDPFSLGHRTLVTQNIGFLLDVLCTV